MAQMPADRLGPGVEPRRGELSAQLADQLHHRRVGAPRRGVGPPRSGLERGVALDAPAGHQPGHPRPRHPVVRGRLRVGSPLHNNSADHQTGLRHGPTLKPLRRFLCLAPSGSYVLNHHTTVSPMCDVARHRNIANPRGGQLLGWGVEQRVRQGAAAVHSCYLCRDCKMATSDSWMSALPT